LSATTTTDTTTATASAAASATASARAIDISNDTYPKQEYKYLDFCRDYRQTVKLDNPTSSYGEISMMLYELWQTVKEPLNNELQLVRDFVSQLEQMKTNAIQVRQRLNNETTPLRNKKVLRTALSYLIADFFYHIDMSFPKVYVTSPNAWNTFIDTMLTKINNMKTHIQSSEHDPCTVVDRCARDTLQHALDNCAFTLFKIKCDIDNAPVA
jgi:hypothetical protein